MCDYGRLGKPNRETTWDGSKSDHFGPKKWDSHDKNPANKKVKNLLVDVTIKRLTDTAVFKVSRGFIHNVWTIADECTNILIKKQEDYGPHNIGQAPGGALNGLIVRIHDKISRIKHLTESKVEPNNESLRDSYIDLANYALIALMVLDGTWPKE